MSRKIIGVTVGTTLPKPNFKQDDPTKGDYIRNKPDFAGLENRVDTVSGLVGDTAVSQQITDAIDQLNKVYAQNEEPTDAPDGAVWIDLDEEEKTEADMIASDKDVLEFVMSMGYANPIINDSNGVYTDNYNNVYVL